MISSARLAFRVWLRETSALLGLGPTAVRMIGVSIAVIGVMLVLGSIQLFDDLAVVVAQGESADARVAVRSLGNGVVLTALIVGGIFGLLTADSSSMDTLLQMVGAGRRQRLAVLVAPTVIVALSISLLINVPLVVTLSAIGGSTANITILVLVGLWVATVTTGLGFGVHRWLARSIKRRLRLPMIHANVGAMAVVLASGLAIGWPAVSPQSSNGFPRSLSFGEIIDLTTGAVLDGDGATVLAAVALTAVLTVLTALVLTASAAEVADVSNRSTGLTGRIIRPPRRGTIALLVWYEALCLGRAPTTLMSAIGVVASAATAALWPDSAIGLLGFLLVGAVSGAVGLHATGVNIGASWMLWSTVGRTWRLGLAKVLGGLLIATTLFGTAAVILIPVVGAGAVFGAYFQFTLPTYVGSLLAGSLVPVNGQQPLTSAAAGALTLVVAGGGFFAVERALAVFGPVGEAVTVPVFLAVVSFGVVTVVGRLRSESVVQRA